MSDSGKRFGLMAAALALPVILVAAWASSAGARMKANQSVGEATWRWRACPTTRTARRR